MSAQDPFQNLAPRSHAEMVTMLLASGLVRAYGDIADAAWRGRLSNADIALIERRVVQVIAEANVAAHEFPEFEMEKSVAEACARLRELFAACAKSRVRDDGRKGR